MYRWNRHPAVVTEVDPEPGDVAQEICARKLDIFAQGPWDDRASKLDKPNNTSGDGAELRGSRMRISRTTDLEGNYLNQVSKLRPQ